MLDLMNSPVSVGCWADGAPACSEGPAADVL